MSKPFRCRACNEPIAERSSSGAFTFDKHPVLSLKYRDGVTIVKCVNGHATVLDTRKELQTNR